MGQKYREMPGDFHQVMAMIGGRIHEVRRHYKCGAEAARRWMIEGGYQIREYIQDKRPVPADFAEKAAYMHKRRLSRHYDCGRGTLDRWISITGIVPPPAPKVNVGADRKSPPEDWAEICAKLPLEQVRRHYKCGSETAQRWIDETGVRPMSGAEYRKLTNQVRKATAKKVVQVRRECVRIDVVHEVAAKTLARYAPTYRCNERGKVDVVGAFFRHGMTVLTPDELLAKAERYRSKAA